MPTRYSRDEQKSKWYLGRFESRKHVVTLMQNAYSEMTADLKEALRDCKIICDSHVD